MSEWRVVTTVDDLECNDVTEIHIDGLAIAIHDTPSGLYATSARCTHAGANLCDGYLDRHVIECPLHQGCFDVRDGKPLDAPVTRALRTWPLRVVAGRVEILVG